MIPASGTNAPSSVSLGNLPFDLDPGELRRRTDATLARVGAELSELLAARSPPTVTTTLVAVNRLLARVDDVGAHGNLLFAVHPDEATRTAGRGVSEAADRFVNGFRLNETVYARLRALDLSGETEPTRFALSKILREMRRAGVEKDALTRTCLLALTNEIDRVANQFSENIAKLDRAIVVEGTSDLAGLPPDYLAAHPPGSDGKVRITTRYPDFFPVMAFCDSANVRRRLLDAFLHRAHPENRPVLERLLALRRDFALLLGYPNFAAFAIEDKMMGSPARARAFLDRVGGILAGPARADMRRYLERKRRDEPGAKALEPWDTEMFGRGYYDSKLRAEEFGVDTRALRAYFPFPRVRDGLFDLCRELFGISFSPAAPAPVWHPAVEAYDVSRRGQPLGRCYLDLAPRPGKFSHAACFTVRVGVAGVQLPQAALICNFLDPGQPAGTVRMSWEDVITFFHEFGHLLHALLAGQNRWLYNGQAHVEWDFIEAPSQLFEEWARDPATLARFALNPETGERIPPALLVRLGAAEAMGRPSRLLRQVALASASLELYVRDPTGRDPRAGFGVSWDRYYPRPLPDDYHPESSFGHLTGYSAFYYTYLWSSVIARDLLSPFAARGTLTDPELADRYAAEILVPGSDRPAAELVRTYLGRPFNFGAFERWAVGAPPGRARVARGASRPSGARTRARRRSTPRRGTPRGRAARPRPRRRSGTRRTRVPRTRRTAR